MALVLPVELESRVRAHAEEGYPEEVCGVLLGRVAGDGAFVADEARRMPNERKEERARRYVIDPLRILRLEDELDAEGRGRRIIGYYHSHPDQPALPSLYDRDHAWPNLSYLIVRVVESGAEEATSWRLADDRGGMANEPVRHA